jgi:hypothetical protein
MSEYKKKCVLATKKIHICASHLNIWFSHIRFTLCHVISFFKAMLSFIAFFFFVKQTQDGYWEKSVKKASISEEEARDVVHTLLEMAPEEREAAFTG